MSNKFTLGLRSAVLLIALCFGLMISADTHARTTTVPALQLTGLNQFAGKNITVFYVSGRSPGLSTPGSELHVHKVFSSQGPFQVSRSGEVEVPANSVLSNQAGVVFNHVLFVVHDQSRVALQNRDGTCPAPAQVTQGRSRGEYCRDSSSSYRTVWQSHRVSRSLRGSGPIRINL